MEIELVVTDLDGTLWLREDDIPAANLGALQRIVAAGLPVLVATGRRVGSTQAPLAAVGLAPPAVVLNGALGLDLASGARFHRGGFPTAEAVDVLDVFVDAGLEPCVYIDDDVHQVCVGAAPSTHPEHLASFGPAATVADLSDVVRSRHVLGFSVLSIPEGRAAELGRALAHVSTPHVGPDRKYGDHAVTVAPSAASKWDGIVAFCRDRGLDDTAVLVVGDGPNDTEMLANAAVAVVPDDGHDSALRHADHVIPAAEDGGWAHVVPIVGV